jgi:hypothetical protein
MSSLLVTQPDTTGDPLGASRVTLLGNILPVPVPDVAEARKLYLARYASSKYLVCNSLLKVCANPVKVFIGPTEMHRWRDRGWEVIAGICKSRS